MAVYLFSRVREDDIPIVLCMNHPSPEPPHLLSWDLGSCLIRRIYRARDIPSAVEKNCLERTISIPEALFTTPESVVAEERMFCDMDRIYNSRYQEGILGLKPTVQASRGANLRVHRRQHSSGRLRSSTRLWYYVVHVNQNLEVSPQTLCEHIPDARNKATFAISAGKMDTISTS